MGDFYIDIESLHYQLRDNIRYIEEGNEYTEMVQDFANFVCKLHREQKKNHFNDDLFKIEIE